MPSDPNRVIIGVPRALMERADALISNPALGFKSRDEFAKNALREFVIQQEERAYKMMLFQGKAPPLGDLDAMPRRRRAK